jgi:hypothetical protein
MLRSSRNIASEKFTFTIAPAPHDAQDVLALRACCGAYVGVAFVPLFPPPLHTIESAEIGMMFDALLEPVRFAGAVTMTLPEPVVLVVAMLPVTVIGPSSDARLAELASVTEPQLKLFDDSEMLAPAGFVTDTVNGAACAATVVLPSAISIAARIRVFMIVLPVDAKDAGGPCRCRSISSAVPGDA